MTATLVAKDLAGGYAHRVLFEHLNLTVAPGDVLNISGTYDSGNFTAHGYSNATIAAISTTFKKLTLIRKVLAVEPLLGSHDEVGRLQGEQVIYYLETFRHELSFLVAVLLQFERTNVFYLILANHLLLFLIFNGCKGSIKSRQYKIKSAKYFVFPSIYTIFAI